MENETPHSATATNKPPTERLRQSLEEATQPQRLPRELMFHVWNNADWDSLTRVARTNTTHRDDVNLLLFRHLKVPNKSRDGHPGPDEALLDGLYRFCYTHYGKGDPEGKILKSSVTASLENWEEIRRFVECNAPGTPEVGEYLQSIDTLVLTNTKSQRLKAGWPPAYAANIWSFMKSIEGMCSLRQLTLRKFFVGDYFNGRLLTPKLDKNNLGPFPPSLRTLKFLDVSWYAKGILWGPNVSPPTQLHVLEVRSTSWHSGFMGWAGVGQLSTLTQLRSLTIFIGWIGQLGLGRLLTLPMLETLCLGKFTLGGDNDHSDDLEEIVTGSHPLLQTLAIMVDIYEATSAQNVLIERLAKLAEAKDSWPSLSMVDTTAVWRLNSVPQGEDGQMDDEEESDDDEDAL